ncbi:MAG: hypothetical protein J6126_01345, partial [Clostridia bacterium]|nr:hypothetical protein [Clostridia bacterium]
IWHVFGVKADLDGLTIDPASYIPFERACITLHIKGAEISVLYEKTGEGRTYTADGRKVSAARFINDELNGKKLSVKITD